MDKRLGFVFFLLGVWLSASGATFLPQEPGFLAPTDVIDHEHPLVIQTVAKVVEGYQEDRDKAIAIHDFVRDQIPFGFSRSFYRMKASEVLEERKGYCVTKSTLFVAMLRAAGIPARQVFVEISAEINKQFDVPGDYLDHSYVEVRLSDRWVKVDSFIVDKKLYESAMKKLKKEGLVIGYGLHRSGTYLWDGISDSFSQFLDNGEFEKLTRKRFGVFRDYKEFYDKVNGNNELSWVERQLLKLFIGFTNGKIERLREESGV